MDTKSSITKSAFDELQSQLAVIPPGKRGVVILTGDVRNGIPSGRAGVAWRANGVLSIGAEMEARLKQRPSSKVWVGLAFVLLLIMLPAASDAQTRYPGTLLRVVDGDTFVIRVDLAFGVSYTATIRLADLDTPELRTAEGKAAKAAAERLLNSGRITVEPTGAMTFARHVAHVYVAGQSVADVLAAAGFRKP